MVQLVPGLCQKFYQSQQTVFQLSPLQKPSINFGRYAKLTINGMSHKGIPSNGVIPSPHCQNFWLGIILMNLSIGRKKLINMVCYSFLCFFSFGQSYVDITVLKMYQCRLVWRNWATMGDDITRKIHIIINRRIMRGWRYYPTYGYYRHPDE